MLFPCLPLRTKTLREYAKKWHFERNAKWVFHRCTKINISQIIVNTPGWQQFFKSKSTAMFNQNMIARKNSKIIALLVLVSSFYFIKSFYRIVINRFLAKTIDTRVMIFGPIDWSRWINSFDTEIPKSILGQIFWDSPLCFKAQFNMGCWLLGGRQD